MEYSWVLKKQYSSKYEYKYHACVNLMAKHVRNYRNEFYYAPNFEEAEGAYWFGPVRPWCVVHYILHTVKNS